MTTADDKITTQNETFDEKNMSMWVHLATFTDLIVPLSSIIVKVIIWRIYMDKSAFFNTQAKEAINFEITMWIVGFISIPLMLVLIGIPLFFATLIISFVLPIIAAIKAHDGVEYRYPLTVRFIK